MEAFGETDIPQVKQTAEIINNMGDRSPKANQKKSSQKVTAASSADLKKKQAAAAKSAPAGKKK